MSNTKKTSLRASLGPQAYHLLELCGYRQIRRPLYHARTTIDRLARSVLAHTPLRRRLLCEIENITNIRNTHPDIQDYRVVASAHETPYNDPHDRDFLKNSQCFQDAVYRQPEHFTCTIKNAYINLHHGAVATSDGILLAESAMEQRRMSINGAYRSRRRNSVKKLDGEYTTIWGMWGNQFYHWWLDCLPRVYSLMSLRQDLPVLLPSSLSSFHQQSLDAILPNSTPTVSIDHDRWFRVDSLVFPSFVTWKACGYLPPGHADYLRNACFEYARVDESVRRSKRLYVSRNNVRRRRVINEDAVIDCLSPLGFEVCHPESMTLAEQIRLFHAAEFVVAPHGSALVNLLFAEKAKVLELFQTQSPQTHFFFLCKSLDHEYLYLMHNEADEHANFTVNLHAFKEQLDKLLND